MDLPKRVLPQGERAARSASSPRRSPKAMRPREMEVDENVSPECSVEAGTASPQRKKVLGQRNGGGGGREASSAMLHQPKTVPSPTSLGDRGAGTYDPKTNYTTPRPDFMRYNPERTREIHLRLRLEREVEDECSSSTSGTVVSEAVSSCSSALGSDSECDDVDEEEVVPVRRGGWARRLFLLLVVVACSFCYIYCMSSAPFPASQKEYLNFVGRNRTFVDDAGVHQVVSLLEDDMMSSEDVLESAAGQVMHRDCDDGVYLHGPGDSPINFMAIAMMGLADVCPNVPFGELTCQIGDERSEDVNDLKKYSELGEQKAEVIKNAEGEVVCLDADAVGDSIVSIHSADTEEVKLRLINHEEVEDYSNLVPQLVSVEKIMESESEKLNNKECLEFENLDQEPKHSEEYENTAEAAKAICTVVKKMWPAMEPHLLQMLACLSVAGFVAVTFKYSQRSRKVPVPVSNHIPSVPPAQVPVLAPHRIAQLSVFPSPPAVKLPMFRSEQPVQQTVPKEKPFISSELPMQSPRPKPDPSVSLQVPLIVHGNHDQKIQQGDADNMMASEINVIDHEETGSLKPPVVALLGEFSFLDAGSSSGRSIKDSNWHRGDATVQESLSLRNDVVKMQNESSKIQSPSVKRARKKQDNAEAEKMDATPTPLRRSSRVRKLTSP